MIPKSVVGAFSNEVGGVEEESMGWVSVTGVFNLPYFSGVPLDYLPPPPNESRPFTSFSCLTIFLAYFPSSPSFYKPFSKTHSFEKILTLFFCILSQNCWIFFTCLLFCALSDGSWETSPWLFFFFFFRDVLVENHFLLLTYCEGHIFSVHNKDNNIAFPKTGKMVIYYIQLYL